MRLSMSLKKGMTSAMTNAPTHVSPTMAAQVPQPTTVFSCLWRELRKSRKKTKREVTDCKLRISTAQHSKSVA